MPFLRRLIRKIEPKDIRIISIIIFVLAILAYFAKYFLSIFLAHYMSAIEFGDFSIAIRILTFITSLVLMGTDLSSNRYLSQYLAFHEKENIRSYITWNIKIISLSFSICIITALITALTMHVFHVLGIKRLDTYHISVFVIWVAPLASISALLASYLLCANHPLYSNFFGNLGKYLIQVIFFLSAVFIFDKNLSTRMVVGILMLSFLVLILIEIFVIRRRAPRIFAETLRALSFPHKEIKKDWLELSLNLITNDIIFSTMTMLDLIIVKIICHNQKLTGYYAACLTIIGFIWMLANQTYGTLKSKISANLLVPGGALQLQKEFDQTNKIFILINIVLCAAIIIFSKTLLGHFGPNYPSAALALNILVVATFIGSLSRPALMLLAFSGNETSLLKLTFIELVIYLVTAIPLTYYYQLIGISTATLIAIVFKTIALNITVRKYVGIKPLIIV